MAEKSFSIDLHLQHLEKFYYLLGKLQEGVGGMRRLGECQGRMSWPKRGVYYFFEPDEYRQDYPSQMRVVRVGTHAVSQNSQTTLWNRLRTHRGGRNGHGNHRGSIFRLHVGKALLVRSPDSFFLSTWGVKLSAPREVRQKEVGLEKLVSEHLGRMQLLWLDVDDEPGTQSRRSYLERQSIGLLTNHRPPYDQPSKSWLGNHSSEQLIRENGLWNLNYCGEGYEPGFLNVLEDAVHQTLANRSVKQFAPNSIPDKFEFTVGGYTGSSFSVVLRDCHLIYQRFNYGFKLAETVDLCTNAEDWQLFWKKLNELGIWSWKKKYIQRGVCDGTNWSINLKCMDKELLSEGSNAFPSNFRFFCHAVSQLMGGREIS